jgi:hypothetical protein
MSYFKDFTNAEVGKEIERLCQLADLKLPELPKETAEFIKDEFARVPKDVFRKSIDEYIAGSIEVEAYAKANAKFLCRMLRAYISKHRHKITFKPHEYVEQPKPEVKPLTEKEQTEKDLGTINHLHKLWKTNIVEMKAQEFIAYPYIVLVHKLMNKHGLLFKPQHEEDDREVEQWGNSFDRYRNKMNNVALNSAPNKYKKAVVLKAMDAMHQNSNFDYQIIGEVFFSLNHGLYPIWKTKI